MRSTTEQDRVATLAFRYRGTPHGWLTEDSKFAETAIRKRKALGYHSREAVAPSAFLRAGYGVSHMAPDTR